MCADWVQVSEVARNVALTISAPVAAIIAWRGLNTWKREKKWDRDHEIAKNLLVELRHRADAFRHLRSRFMPANEMEDAAREAIKAGNVKDTKVSTELARDLASAKRVQNLNEARARFYSYQIEADAVWPKSIEPFSDRLEEIERRVISALEMIDFYEAGEMTKQVRSDLVQYRKTAFGDEGDEIGSEYGSAVDEIRNFLKPRLRS